MRLKDLSIRARLGIGFGVLTLLTTIIGMFAIVEMWLLVGVTADMYSHPLTVSNAVRDIQSRIFAMHHNMKDVVLARTEEQLQGFAALVDEEERTVSSLFEMVSERFLGDKSDVLAARQAFEDWRAIRVLVFSHMRAGEVDEAVAITQGRCAKHVDRMNELNQTMSSFARGKADEFYDRAHDAGNRGILIMSLFLLLVVATSAAVALLIGRSFTRPLGAIGDGIRRLAKGRLDEPIGMEQKDEIGQLAAAFDRMAGDLARTTTSIDELNREIREREAAEAELRKNHNLLDAVIESAPDAVYVKDLDGKYLLANTVTCKTLGRERIDVIGRDDTALFSAETSRQLMAKDRQIIQHQKAQTYEETTTHQGETIPWITTKAPFRDQDGEVLGLVGISQNISGLKEAEDRERNLGRIIEESLNEVYIFDAESLKFLSVNRGARENLGYSMEELRTMDPLDLKPDYTPETFAALVLPLRAGEREVIQFETVHLRKDGTTYPVEAHLQLARHTLTPAFVAIILDTTERRRAEQGRRDLEAQVQHTQKLESLGVLAGGIAHDFNNLLMAVLGNAALALEDLSPVSPVRDNLRGIETAAGQAADLCKQMLAYSGKGKFESRPLDLGEVVAEMGHMLEVAVSKSAVLRYKLTEGLPAVHADSTQLQQIILNLITNASEAIGDKSGIISAATGVMDCDRAYFRDTYLDENLPEGSYVYMEVSDTGCGMSEETMQRIFEPFFSTKFSGRGLGMAAVLGIVRGHSGAIKVYSELGSGTTIKVLFPALDEPAVVCPSKPVPRVKRQGSGTVLLVDDEDTVRALGRCMLERMGFAVLTAADGKEAVEVLCEHTGDIVCVLLDLTMPHMGGEDAFREMRRIRKDIKIILSSGYNEQEVAQRFAGKGLEGFLQKPYKPQELAEKLDEVLAQ